MNGNKGRKHILIAVVGLTPQVITETIYYFYKIRKQPIKEVYVITTQPGREKIISPLFQGGILQKLCNKLKVNKEFRFDKDSIYVITDRRGNPLKDIRTIEDNERVAEVIWNLVKEYTSMDDVIVHCSVAGGRKTMGVYAAIVMSLLGRKGDTLSHILIDEEKESSDFYYPLDEADEKKLSLAEIPYIRLREILSLGKKKLNFVQRIKDYQRELDKRFIPKKVIIDYEEKIIDGGKCGKINFTEREFFIYSLLAEKRKQCRCENGCKECFIGIKDIQKKIPEYKNKFGKYFSATTEGTMDIMIPKDKEDKLYDKDAQQLIREIMTRINTKIENAEIFNRDFFKIQKLGRRGNFLYGLSIPSRIIQFSR